MRRCPMCLRGAMTETTSLLGTSMLNIELLYSGRETY